MTHERTRAAAGEIAGYWNGQSEKFAYGIGEGVDAESYSIIFNVTVEVDDTNSSNMDLDFLTSGYERAKEGRENNPTNNEINSFVSSSDFKAFNKNEKLQGIANGFSIVISNTADNKKNTGKHEVGHNFGMSHTTGLMKDSATGDGQTIDVTRKSVSETLSRVGLGSEKYGNLSGNPIGSINGVTGAAPANFSTGSVVTQKKFDRIKNREIRRSEKKSK